MAVAVMVTAIAIIVAHWRGGPVAFKITVSVQGQARYVMTGMGGGISGHHQTVNGQEHNQHYCDPTSRHAHHLKQSGNSTATHPWRQNLRRPSSRSRSSGTGIGLIGLTSAPS